MMEKDHFKENVLLRPQVSFKNSILTVYHINFLFVEEMSSEAWLVNSSRNSREENRNPEMSLPFLG